MFFRHSNNTLIGVSKIILLAPAFICQPEKGKKIIFIVKSRHAAGAIPEIVAWPRDLGQATGIAIRAIFTRL